MTVRIRNLRVRTTIGVYPRERRRRRTVLLNIELEYDARRAARTDDLRHAVDYDALAGRIVERVSRCRFRLLEALAESVLSMVLAEPKALRATVEAVKPGALRSAEGVSVVCSGARKGRR